MASPVCPICNSPCERYPKNEAFPFCSKRCKLADLHNWLGERYVLPDESAAPSDLDDAEDESRLLH
jgi:endogenous inhibitor of DNA gyrase (YacG/DUF329 family)